MASEGFHEDTGALRPETMDVHRAITSLMEELEAVDWYNQRVDAAGDAALAQILAHNRDEEKEHAAMLLEWLRRHDSALDVMLRRYLFTDADILDVEEAPSGDAGSAGEPPGAGTLGIGSLRGEEPNL